MVKNDTPRKQPTYVETGVARKRILNLMIVVVSVVILILSVLIAVVYEPPEQAYKPPALEKNAVSGVPDVPANYDYSGIIYENNIVDHETNNQIADVEVFRYAHASVLYRQDDGSLKLYFTNFESNEMNLLCEVLDTKGNTLYKSGLLRPGEYVESLYPARKIKNVATEIEVKVYAFDENYYSKGTAILSNFLQPK